MRKEAKVNKVISIRMTINEASRLHTYIEENPYFSISALAKHLLFEKIEVAENEKSKKSTEKSNSID